MAKRQVGAQLNEDEQRRLERYRRSKGFEFEADALREALDRGLSDWERSRDPAQSWLLNVGMAALLWAILAVWGFVTMGFPSFEVAAFSIYMAFVFLFGHLIQIARVKQWSRLIIPGWGASQ